MYIYIYTHIHLTHIHIKQIAPERQTTSLQEAQAKTLHRGQACALNHGFKISGAHRLLLCLRPVWTKNSQQRGQRLLEIWTELDETCFESLGLCSLAFGFDNDASDLQVVQQPLLSLRSAGPTRCKQNLPDQGYAVTRH